MKKEIIISYLLASNHLKKRAEYDISHNPKLEIKSLTKEGNKYHIKGILNVNLGIACHEINIFDCIFFFNQEEINLKTKVHAINEFYNNSPNKSGKNAIIGETSTHTDTFCIRTIDDKKYLIQIIEHSTTKIYEVENNYSLKLGMTDKIRNREVKEKDILKSNKLHKKLKIRNRYSNSRKHR